MWWLVVLVAGTVAIVAGAELFAEHLAAASARLGVTTFALALLLAGAEPEELATVIAASARGVDGVALGDVIGANVAIVTVALGVGAVVSSMPFGPRVRRYALGGVAASLVGSIVVWDGAVTRLEGLVLVGGYVVLVGAVWILERRPPPLGETGELAEADPTDGSGLVGRDLGLVVVGIVTLAAGSFAVVEAVRRLSGVESTQTQLGLVLVGFATAFELVVLAWSASRRGMSEVVVAGVVGSFAYNMTMSLSAGAVVAPIQISEAGLIRGPFIAMVALMVVAMGLARRGGMLTRRDGVLLLAGYPVFVAVVVVG